MGKPSMNYNEDSNESDFDESSSEESEEDSESEMEGEEEKEEEDEKDEEEESEEENEEEDEEDDGEESEEDESEEDEESEEEETEEENAEMVRIIDDIETMPDSETAKCKSGNDSLLYVIRKTEEIRRICKLDDYGELHNQMEGFTKDKKTIQAFEEFRGICQFIMDIHKRYHVQLKENTDNIDLVLDIIRNVLGKYTNQFPNIQNNTLTTFSQCTTV